MAKKKRGRGRGRGGQGGYFQGNGQHFGGRRHRPRHYQGGGDRPPGGGPEQELQENGEPLPLEPAMGVLELHPNGYGFLRDAKNNYSR
ncbi:MAG TPA: transcription termination factor Rho, partial [Pirellulales bacterium]|nr:transcription termination factor Rho [Pirellulales bacterium]